MKRFGIRNYGPTRQVPFKDKQIFIARDGFIETDDEEEATVLKDQENLYVIDRGAEFATPEPMVTTLDDDDRKVTADDPEALYSENHPDEDEQSESQINDEEIESSEEIAYQDMTVVELKVIAKDREFNVKGLKKAEIIEVLEDYDEEIVELENDGVVFAENRN